MLRTLSLKYRIAIAIFLLVEMVMAAGLLPILFVERERHRAERAMRVETTLTALVAVAQEEMLEARRYGNLASHLARATRDPFVTGVMVVDAQGQLVAASPPELQRQPFPPADAATAAGWVQRPLLRGPGDRLGRLAARFAPDRPSGLHSRVIWMLLAVALGGAAVALGVSLLLGRVLTRRMASLLEAMQRYSAGAPELPTAVSGTDEVGQLGRAFQDMAARIGADRTRGMQEAEAALAASEARFRLLLLHAEEGVVLHDRAMTIIDANPRFCELTGYALEELVGRPYTILVTPEELERQPMVPPGALAGSKALIERRYRRKDGTALTVELSANRLDEEHTLCIVRDITERKRAEAALQQSAELSRTLLQSVFDGVVIHTNGVILETNPAYERMYGYSKEELRGKNVLETLIAPECREQLRQRFALPVTQPLESVGLRKDGSRFTFEGVGRNFEHQGVPARIAALRDISERKRAEAALRESEELFRTLLSAVFDGIVIHEHGTILETNGAYERMYGYSKEELLGQNLLEKLIAPESRELVGKLVQMEAALPMEGIGLRKDGSRLYFEAVGHTQIYKGRRARVGAVREISRRKRYEAALRERESHLQEAQAIANLGSWEWDPAANAVLGSPQFCRIVGREPSEHPIPIAELLATVLPDDAQHVRKTTRELVKGMREAGEMECRIVRADGALRDLHLRGRVQRGEDGQLVRMVGTLQDLTERKALERQLAQAMKMDALGKLTGGVAHDFNNLLTILLGNLRLLERSGLEGNPLLLEAVQAAERGSNLVQRLLAYGRRQPLHPEPVDVNALVNDTVRLLRRTLGEAVEVQIGLAEHPWPVQTDRSQLETALINLALNARDAMPEGGCLEVTTANVRLPEEHRCGIAHKPGAYLRLAVRDNGTGMTEAVREHAFDPFFSTKEVGRGSGLGLSMVYGFAEQSGGFAEIDSELGRGTTVSLYLPGAAPVVAPPPEPPRPYEPAAGGKTILLVEDDPGVRLVTVRILESLGYHVVDVPNGDEALRALRSMPAVDLLFSDIVMPGGMSGQELSTQARRLRPGLTVLLTSGYASIVSPAPSGTARPYFLLPKPYGVTELERKLVEVLEPSASTG